MLDHFIMDAFSRIAALYSPRLSVAQRIVLFSRDCYNSNSEPVPLEANYPWLT